MDWLTVIGVAPDIRLYGVDPCDIAADACGLVAYAHQQMSVRVSRSAWRPVIRRPSPRPSEQQSATPIRTSRCRRSGRWTRFGGSATGSSGCTAGSSADVAPWDSCSRRRRLRRAVVLGVAAHAGDRRAHRAWRQPPQVRRLVVRSGVSLVAVGIAIGLVTAFVGDAGGRNQLLYKVSPFDPLTFAAVSGLLLSVAFLASYMPALRATGRSDRRLKGE